MYKHYRTGWEKFQRDVMPYLLATTEDAALVVEKQIICTITDGRHSFGAYVSILLLQHMLSWRVQQFLYIHGDYNPEVSNG